MLYFIQIRVAGTQVRPVCPYWLRADAADRSHVCSFAGVLNRSSGEDMKNILYWLALNDDFGYTVPITVPTPEVQEEILYSMINNSNTSNSSPKSKEQGKRPKSGPQPSFNSPNFNFQVELKRLPFPINLGEVEMSKAQQIGFLELIYNNQSVFSLCDEDLGLCDCLKYTIPTTMDKPVYLPHHTIPVQLQAEVCKCLDA